MTNEEISTFLLFSMYKLQLNYETFEDTKG